MSPAIALPRLNVYNWGSYVAPTTIPDFEREFHCRVRYATYSSAEEMLAKVMSGNSGWDIVFPSNSFVQPMRELSLLLPLDHARLPNLGNLDPLFRSPEWDPALAFSVPICTAQRAFCTPTPPNRLRSPGARSGPMPIIAV